MPLLSIVHDIISVGSIIITKGQEESKLVNCCSLKMQLRSLFGPNEEFISSHEDFHQCKHLNKYLSNTKMQTKIYWKWYGLSIAIISILVIWIEWMGVLNILTIKKWCQVIYSTVLSRLNHSMMWIIFKHHRVHGQCIWYTCQTLRDRRVKLKHLYF